MTAKDDILTVKQAAELLQVSDKTMYEWIHIEGSPFDIPPLRLIPYSVLLTTAVTAAGLLLFRRKNIK